MPHPSRTQFQMDQIEINGSQARPPYHQAFIINPGYFAGGTNQKEKHIDMPDQCRQFPTTALDHPWQPCGPYILWASQPPNPMVTLSMNEGRDD